MYRMNFLVSIEGRERLVSQLFDRHASTASEIEYLSIRSRICNGADPRVNHVIDVDEIARLFPITEDGEWLITQNISNKNTKNALVWIVERLPWTVNVVHADRVHMEGKIQVDQLCSGVDLTVRWRISHTVV